MSINRVMALVIAGTLVATPVFADKPESAGKGKGKNKESRDHVERSHGGSHFGERQQVAVREYYEQEYRGGR